MSINFHTSDFSTSKAKAAENAKALARASESLKNEYISCFPTDIKKAEGSEESIKKIVDMTNLSLKMYSNSHYKQSTYLDTTELEQIKRALANYKSDNKNAENFKKEIINDLTNFEKQIRENHTEKIVKYTKEKQQLEKELFTLNLNKNKLIMDRLSKIVWPYDSKTKEFDSQIATTEAKIQQCTKKIEDLQTKRPIANEKDLLIYKMQFKEKFAQA